MDILILLTRRNKCISTAQNKQSGLLVNKIDVITEQADFLVYESEFQLGCVEA